MVAQSIARIAISNGKVTSFQQKLTRNSIGSTEESVWSRKLLLVKDLMKRVVKSKLGISCSCSLLFVP